MNPKLHIIDTTQGVQDLIDYLQDKEYIAYDCETTGLTKRDEIIGFSICAEETQSFYVILAKWNVTLNGLDYCNSELKEKVLELITLLSTKSLIMHNAIFDCMMAEAFFKVRLIDALHTDTMIAAHLLDENNSIGLKELAQQYFGDESATEQKEMKESVIANGGTLTKSKYEMYKADAYLMAKYGAKDALLTYKLFIEFVPQLVEQGLDDFFYVDESMPLLKGPTYELNNTGIQIDTKKLTQLKKQLEVECMEAKAFIYKEIEPHIKHKYPGTNKKDQFNVGSNVQLSWLMFGVLNVEFNTLTKEGKNVCKSLGLKLPYTKQAKKDFIEICIQAKDRVYTQGVKPKKIKDPWSYIAVDKKTLQKNSSKYKWIEKLLEHNRKNKILNTYVIGIEDRVQYGVLYPQFKQAGTTSGRYSSTNPNFQNLPRNDKRIKECIVARPNKTFVGADYSQLEPRVFSYFSGDTRLMSAFDGTKDFYSVVGMGVFNKTDCTPQKDGSSNAFGVKYEKLRDLSKTIALASAYGATAFQLAPTTGKSVDETQEDMDTYFQKFPGVKKMMNDAHELAKKNGYVTSLFGRPRRIPEAKKIDKIYGTGQLPYEARSLLNLACNHRIQSTGASIMNRAMIKFYELNKELGLTAKIVSQIHDELIVECDTQNVETISLLLQTAMEDTTKLPGINFEAAPWTSNNFAKN